MDTFGLKIIASDRVFYEGRCRKLVIPAPDGEKGILPNHENMVIAVKIGMARMEIEEGNRGRSCTRKRICRGSQQPCDTAGRYSRKAGGD